MLNLCVRKLFFNVEKKKYSSLYGLLCDGKKKAFIRGEKMNQEKKKILYVEKMYLKYKKLIRKINCMIKMCITSSIT